jgi:hypothetical protein
MEVLGITVGKNRDGKTVVTAIRPDSPAASWLEVDDVFLSIDDELHVSSPCDAVNSALIECASRRNVCFNVATVDELKRVGKY